MTSIVTKIEMPIIKMLFAVVVVVDVFAKIWTELTNENKFQYISKIICGINFFLYFCTAIQKTNGILVW